MADEAPSGYDEIGESIAQAVIQGAMTRRYASELASISGYGAKVCRSWLEYYRSTHAEEVEELERRTHQRSAKLEAIRRKSAALRRKAIEALHDTSKAQVWSSGQEIK